MSVDYLALECIRGAPIEDVAEAIETALAATGWIAGVSAVGGDRPIQLVEHGPWIVVDDRHDLASTRWAETLSASLGGAAISLRVLDDEYSLRRYEAGALVGELGNEAAKRKALALRIAGKSSERSEALALDRKVLVRTAFLADLASGASRTTLTAGVKLAPSRANEALLAIAKLAKLPAPLSPYDEPEPDLQLCFRPGPPPARARRKRIG